MNQQQRVSQPLMDMMIASHPCHPHIRLGPKEQNNSVTVGFERRPAGNEILRTALTHREQLGRRRELGNPGWNPEDQHEAGLLYRAGVCLAAWPGPEFQRQGSKRFPVRGQKIQIQGQSQVQTHREELQSKNQTRKYIPRGLTGQLRFQLVFMSLGVPLLTCQL